MHHSAYVVTVVNTKGGVGKSTTAANLAAICADLGQRVLLIDLDDRCSLSNYFSLTKRSPHGLAQVLLQRAILPSSISSTTITDLDIVLYDDAMRAALLELPMQFQPTFALEQAVHAMRGDDFYDLVIVDTPGATGLRQDMGIVAADQLVAPLQPETMCVAAIQPMIELLKRYEQGAPNSRYAAIPCTGFISRAPDTNLARELTQQIRQMFLATRGRFRLCDTIIPVSAVVDKATYAHQPIHRVEPQRKGQLGPISARYFGLVADLFPHLHDRVHSDANADSHSDSGATSVTVNAIGGDHD